MSVNEELLPLRNKIDGLDSELVRLLNERAGRSPGLPTRTRSGSFKKDLR